MNRTQLIQTIKSKRSFLCVGLDTDMTLIPQHLLDYDNPILEFNKKIIDATRDHCVAYKPNFAFYEALGSKGWDILRETIAYIGKEHLTIADAKRGDIGNTAEKYAKAIFEDLQFDAVTVAPYMGEDSITPFLNYQDKWTIALALTSNPGHRDFQLLSLAGGQLLYQAVVERLCKLGSPEQLMLVVGATRSEHLEAIRSIAPDHFWLVPGIGAQGGSLDEVWDKGRNRDIGLLVNSSRGIQYASSGLDFEEAAQKAAQAIQLSMGEFMNKM